MKKYKLKIEGMNCEGCVISVRKTLEKLDARDITISLEENSAEFYAKEESIEEIVSSIVNRGYEVKEVIKYG